MFLVYQDIISLGLFGGIILLLFLQTAAFLPIVIPVTSCDDAAVSDQPDD